MTSDRTDSVTEKEKIAQPSCVMLKMTHRGKHCRLYNVIKKGGVMFNLTLPSSMMFSMTQRGEHYHLV